MNLHPLRPSNAHICVAQSCYSHAIFCFVSSACIPVMKYSWWWHLRAERWNQQPTAADEWPGARYPAVSRSLAELKSSSVHASFLLFASKAHGLPRMILSALCMQRPPLKEFSAQPHQCPCSWCPSAGICSRLQWGVHQGSSDLSKQGLQTAQSRIHIGPRYTACAPLHEWAYMRQSAAINFSVMAAVGGSGALRQPPRIERA